MGGKLELTWVGKNKEIKVEPRILLEDKEKSNCINDPNTENMLIHGDNLLALKALESKYAGQVKCIYIDPPYNTGSAFEHYDDNLEHSTWLSLMKPRLEILKNLLSEDGSIWISIDENEGHYLKVLCDEIFGRRNFITMTTIKRGAVTGHKAINPSPVQVTDLMLTYTKNKQAWKYTPVYRKREYDKAYSQFIENYELGYEKWTFISLKEAMTKYNFSLDSKKFNNIAHKIIRFAQPDYKAVGEETRKLIDFSKKDTKVHLLKRENYPDIYMYKGNRILFYKSKLRMIDGHLVTSELVTNIWDDMNYQGIAREGSVIFQRSKKPEVQIKRILEMSTNEGDLVLDSFLGSGTTVAVAHKMGRKYIGIEMGDHAYTHCKVRLDKVIDGTDQGGISKTTNWQGGGAYKFYELAPTLINHDDFDEPIINTIYDKEMLASAIALHEGYTYQPDKNIFWKQSKGSENSYLFVTTRQITKTFLDSIKTNMEDNEHLIIACKSYENGLDKIYKQITIKKIPQMLLERCEFGKDNYNLNIITPPIYKEDENEE